MNIIDINETKLWELIYKASERNLADPFFVMNDDTSKMLEARCCEHITYESHKINAYYDGVEMVTDNNLKFGEVQMYGYEEKMATIFKIYATGETDIYTNQKERILVRID